MKFVKTLKTLLWIQLVMYAWYAQILFSASHDQADDFSALFSFVPMGIFVILGIINITLLVVYLVKVAKKKLPIDRVVVGVAATITVLVVLYPWILLWLAPGAG